MDNETQTLEILEAAARRREERREFLRTTRGGAMAALGVSLLSACSGGGDDEPQPAPEPPAPPTPPPPPPPPPGITDADILNFALNLEYLEAQFYSFAAFGEGLPQNLLGGTGNQGEARGGRQVNFNDPIVAQHARELAIDERAHVAFLRAALGASAVAQPQINISPSSTGAFSAAARAAGLIGPNEAFDPYANDQSFLLAAFIFEDVGVTAYKGASPLLESKVFLEAAAGILAAEAYHASMIRTTLFQKGMRIPQLLSATTAISDARDSLDGPEDKDQGIVRGERNLANIVPANGNGIAFSRTAGEVLNIVYLTPEQANKGGFFPRGVNGTIMESDDNSG
ncbi:MAG TPA: ferritin-like domain-containing protein [Allosphingosinicella sp.]